MIKKVNIVKKVNELKIQRNTLYIKTNMFYNISIRVTNTIINKNELLDNIPYSNNVNDYNGNVTVDRSLIYKLVTLCMRKGKKKKALTTVKKALMLIRKFYGINPILLVKLAIYKTETFLKLYKFVIGVRERIIPTLVNIEKRKKKMHYAK